MRVHATSAHVASAAIKDTYCVDILTYGTVSQEALKAFIFAHISESAEYIIHDDAVALVE